MSLLKYFIRNDLKELCEQNVRILIIGRRDDLSSDILSLLEEAESKTAGNTGVRLIIAFNYGGQDEIVRAVRKIAAAAQRGELRPEDINRTTLGQALDTAAIPDPDLLIRTSGEQRISNFLIWQCAYTEFVFQKVLWPDFSGYDLIDAMIEYQGRERRYGGRPCADGATSLVSGALSGR